MKTPRHMLAEKFGDDRRWVSWKLISRHGKKTKVPYTVAGTTASSTDIRTWSTYEKVKEVSKNVGIVFTPSKTLLGVDLDHCLENGVLIPPSEAIPKLIEQANTYTEISPSGTGLHLYLELVAPLELEANRYKHFEVYTSGRFFTVTNNSFGDPKPVRTVSPDEALKLLTIIGYPWKKTKKTMTIVDEGSDVPPEAWGKLAPIADDLILEKMFESRHGAAIRALWDGDTAAYGNDASRADAALLSHLAFWCGKDSAQMERLWLLSTLGHREKTRNRPDYRLRSLKAAIDLCSEVYEPRGPQGDSEILIDDERLGLLYATSKKVKVYYKNTENMTRLLTRHPEFAGTLRFDAYKNIFERKVHGVWRDFKDSDVLEIQTRISVLFAEFANISKLIVMDAIAKAANDNMVDTGMDYLRSLTWDKTPRLDEWLHRAYHTPDDEYHRTVGANYLKGLARRVMIPGSKFDYVLVLEGAQGIRKSTSLQVLAGPLGHVETTMSTETKDFFMQFLGNAIVEFSEGETLSRTEVKRMKAIITIPADKFREPYGRATVTHPRRCVFAMTTNQTEYLKDETGNRRWLPVAVIGNVDIEWLEENREQLHAEAYHRAMVLKEKTYEFPEEEMDRQQNMRRIQSANMDRILNWYLNTLSDLQRQEGVTTADVFQHALNGGFLSRPTTRSEEIDISDVLRSVLFLDQRREMFKGVRVRRWYPTEKTVSLLALQKEEFEFT